MRPLADTHVYLWWLNDDSKLSPTAREAIADPSATVHISAASIWEIAIKVALGKLEIDGDPVAEIEAKGFIELPMTARHADRAGRLPRHHENPLDRMLIAQAQIGELVLVSWDPRFPAYGISALPA